MIGAWVTIFLKLPVNKNGNAPGFCEKRFMDIRPHKPLKTHVRQHIPKAKIPAGLEKSLQFRKHCRISLAQPYPNCTQHIQIGTMNVYHGAGPSQPADHPDCKPAKRRLIIIKSDSD